MFKEPLLHFLLIGEALFGVYSRMNRGAQCETESLQIRISEGEGKWLKETWAKQWQYEPMRDEFRALLMPRRCHFFCLNPLRHPGGKSMTSVKRLALMTLLLSLFVLSGCACIQK